MARKTSGPSRPPVLEGQVRVPVGKSSRTPVDGPTGVPDDRLAIAEAAARQDKGVAYSQDAEQVATGTESIAGPDAPAAEPSEAPSAPQAVDGAEVSPAHTAAPPPPLRPESASREPSRGVLAAAVMLGALGGLVLAYGLALLGLWPDGSIANLQTRVTALEFVDPAPVAGVAPDDLAVLDQRIGALESVPRAEAGDGDLAAAIVEQVEGAQAAAQSAQETSAALSAEVDRISGQIASIAEASAQGGDAGAALAALGVRVDDLAASINGAGSGTEALQGRVAALEAALAEQPALAQVEAERDRMVQWPLALSALRAAMDAGTPFAAELARVTALSPDLVVPDALARAATEGLPNDRALVAAFAARIPAMLGAAPANPEATWTESLLGQAAAVLALRPAGDVEGNGPQAVLARAEAALDAGDFASAASAMAQLPEPMVEAAGAVPGQIAAKSAADTLIAQAVSLTPAVEAVPNEGAPE